MAVGPVIKSIRFALPRLSVSLLDSRNETASNALHPPLLGESLVQRLGSLASEVDGCAESFASELLRESDSLAGIEM